MLDKYPKVFQKIQFLPEVPCIDRELEEAKFRFDIWPFQFQTFEQLMVFTRWRITFFRK